MRRFSKIILPIVTVIAMIMILCAPCFSTGAAAMSASEIFGVLYSSYLASRGIDVLMSQNFDASSSDNVIPADPAAAMWLDLYNRSNSRFPTASQMNIDDWVTFAESNVSTNIGPAGNVTPTNVTFQMADSLVSWFDKVTTDLLTVDLGVQSDSGVYHTSGNFFDSTVSYFGSSSWPSLPVTAFDKTSILSFGRPVYNDGSSVAVAVSSSSSSYTFFVCAYAYNASFRYLVISPDYNALFYSAARASAYPANHYTTIASSSSDGYYFTSASSSAPLTVDSDIPFYPSLSDALAGFSDDVSDARIQLRPSDKYNEGLKDGTGKTLDKGDVYIPDVTAEGYQPDVLTGTWNIPWQDSFADSLDDVLAKLKELVNANEPVLELDVTAPDPVVIPFLPPSGIDDLPSFDFNLSGIWHYVVDWVGSIGSGFSLISSAWSALPYAMVIPIYASSVVVIVVGVWRRFFG